MIRMVDNTPVPHNSVMAGLDPATHAVPFPLATPVAHKRPTTQVNRPTPSAQTHLKNSTILR
jgi:hypothetical protein